MRRAVLLVLLVLLVGACSSRSPQPTTTEREAGAELGPHRLGLRSTTVDDFTYLTGASGTVTIASGFYVTGIAAHATNAGTLTITPAGPAITTPIAGGAIPIPAGAGIWIGYPAVQGQTNELGAGTVIAFGSTDSYTVTLNPTVN